MKRHLAAVLMADVVGYCRLMEADEAGTLAALKERRRKILEPTIRDHGGRVVKLMGDGALIEFGSAVAAVDAALALQAAMADADAADGRGIRVRIGINLGDVIGEGGKDVVVDFSDTTFIDSTTLGVLVGGVKRLRAQDGRLSLVCSDRNITKIFEITGLDRVFTIYPTRDEALAKTGASTQS